MLNRLQEIRENKGFTQIELARLASVPQSAISEIETRGRIPRIDTAKKISDVLGVTIPYLWPDLAESTVKVTQ